MRRIALDAMGGDDAPGPEVAGAIACARERAIEVVLVGDEARLSALLAAGGAPGGVVAGPGRLRVRHASQVVAMDDQPGAAFKQKRDSSMRVAFDLCAAGEADAVVSAGNSGAMMAHGLFVMKRVPGVDRPGIVTLGPTSKGSYFAALDIGANTAPRPVSLVQFAVLGAAYVHLLLGVARPRVGVLSNGEEEGKGTDLTREAHRLLRDAPPPVDFEFAGYAEGRDFFGGRFDVVVTDGFTGNIALKTYEGTARMIFELLEAEVKRSGRYKLGAWLLLPALRALRRRLEAEEYGGALLLGLQGVAMICHGRSSPKAIKNALFAADRLAGAGLTPALSSAIERHRKLWESEPEQGMEQGTEAAPAPTPSTDGGSDPAGERNPTYQRELASGGRGPSER